MPDYLHQFYNEFPNRLDLEGVLKGVFPDRPSVTNFCRNYIDPYAGDQVSGKVSPDDRDAAVTSLLVQVEARDQLLVLVVSLCCIHPSAISVWAASAVRFIAERSQEETESVDALASTKAYFAGYCGRLSDRQRNALFQYAARAIALHSANALPLLVQALNELNPAAPRAVREAHVPASAGSRSIDEDTLLTFLEGVTPADLARILTRLPQAAPYVPELSSHYQRVAALLVYVRSTGGPGVGRLIAVIDAMFPGKLSAS